MSSTPRLKTVPNEPEKNIIVPTPQNGEHLSVPSSPDGSLVLQFPLIDVSVSREGDSLLFNTNSGTVRVENFFVVGNRGLPTLTLQDGTVTDPTQIFKDMDMTTAAGPEQSPASSGLREYSDHNLTAIVGVDRLGGLGAGDGIQQVQGVLPAEINETIFTPGGSFLLTLDSSSASANIIGVYEDAAPHQNLGDQAIHAGKFSMTFSPSAGSTPSTVTFSGVPEGAKIYLGDPNDLGNLPLTPTGNVYTFSPGSFTAPGVYIIPPADSDTDFDITIQVTFTSNGGVSTVSTSVTIVVDAVADATKISLVTTPGMESTSDIILENGGTITYSTNEESQPDGFAHSSSGTLDTLGHDQVIRFEVTATFGDFTDGSEEHFLLIALPQDWLNSAGYEVVTKYYVDALGNPVHPDAQGNWPEDSAAKAFLKIPVSNASIAPDGSVTVPVEATIPASTQENLDGYVITVISGAEEMLGAGSGQENDLSNNLAFDQSTTQVAINTFNNSIRVTAGWAYENHAESNSGHNPPMAQSDATDMHNGAPISLSFTANAGESISSVILSCPESTGGFFRADGTALGTSPTVSLKDLQSNNIFFRPSGSSDADVDVTYTVNIRDNGASYSITGRVPIVIDAVADANTIDSVVDPTPMHPSGNVSTITHDYEIKDGKNTGFNIGKHQGSDKSAEAQNVSFEVTATFGDLDGSEEHYLLIRAESLPDGWINTGLYPPEVIHVDASGNPVLKNYDGSWPEGSTPATFYKVTIPEGDFSITGSTATATVAIPITIPKGTTENLSGYPIQVVSVSKEAQLNGKEYDLSNNEYYDTGQANVVVNTLNADITVKAGWVYENGITATSSAGMDSTSISKLGAPIFINIDSHAEKDIQEVITKVAIKIPEGLGTLCDQNGTVLKPNADGYVNLDHGPYKKGQIFFKPSPNHSDADIELEYILTIQDGKTGQNVFYTVDGKMVVAVDAVATKTDIKANDITPEFDGTQTALTGQGGDSVDITVKAAFKDTDGSENHYILVEYKSGWLCSSSEGTTVETITIYCDRDGTPLQPTGVDAAGNFTYADTSSPKIFWRMDVSDIANAQKGASHDYKVTLTPPQSAIDITHTFKVGSLSEETVGRNGFLSQEYDYSNNQAFDLHKVTVKQETVDSDLTISATTVYEDNMPNAHVGDNTQVAGGLTFSLTASEGGSGNDYILSGKGDTTAISLTFKCTEKPGTFSIGGKTLDSSTMSYDAATDTYTLRIPSSAIPTKTSSVTINYTPPAHSDADLTDINCTLVAIAPNSQETKNLTANIDRLVVDAVADKPTYVDGTDQSGGFGEKVAVEFTTTFTDLDGSESHYMLIAMHDKFGIVALPQDAQYLSAAEINSINAKIEAYNKQLSKGAAPVDTLAVDGTYLKVLVDGTYHDPVTGEEKPYIDPKTGMATVTIEFTLPKEGEVEINDEGNYSKTLKVVGCSEEKVAQGDPTNTDSNWDNNSAFTQGDYTLTLGTLGKISMTVEGVYEGGATSEIPGAPAGTGLISIIKGASEKVTELVLTFDTPLREGVLQYKNTEGKWVTITPDTKGGSVYTIADYDTYEGLRYYPNSESYSDKDISFSWKATVHETINGDTKDFTGKEIIYVDAVANTPNLTVEALQNGTAGMTLNISAQFYDYDDNSETHYIVVKLPEGARVEMGGKELIGETVGGQYIVKIPVDNAQLQGEAQGLYQESLSVTLPEGSVGSKISIEAWAKEENTNKLPADPQDRDPTIDYELSLDNNEASTSWEGKVTDFTTGVFKGAGGATFESNLPHQNEVGDNQDDGKGGVQILGTAKPGGGLVITKIAVELFDTAPASKDDPWTATEQVATRGILKYTCKEDGEEKTIDVDFSSNPAVLVLPEGVTFDPAKLLFIPQGHGAGRLHMDIKVTVTDPTTNVSMLVEDKISADVNVDAVATMSGQVVGSLSSSGEKVTATINTTFADVDGSENHYVLLEANPDWGFVNLPTGWYNLDGAGVKVYYHIAIPKTSGEFNVADGVTVVVQHTEKGAEVTVKATLQAPENGRGHLSIGSFVEEVNNIDWTAENIAPEHVNNNVSLRPGGSEGGSEGMTWTKDAGPFGLRIAADSSHDGNVTGAVWVGENGASGAPVTLTLWTSGGPEDMTSQSIQGQVTFTFSFASGSGTPQGYLVYTINGSDIRMQLQDGKVTFDMNVLDSHDGTVLKFYPEGGSDQDINVQVSGDNILHYTDKDGATHDQSTSVSLAGGIKVDAEAMTPTVKNSPIDVTGPEDFEANATYSISNINLSFSDVTDGSEKHYLLVEAKPGWSYAGQETWPVQYHDGKAYYALDLGSPDSAPSWVLWEVNDAGLPTGAVSISGLTITTPDTIFYKGGLYLNYGGMALELHKDSQFRGENDTPTEYDHNNREWNLDNNCSITINTGKNRIALGQNPQEKPDDPSMPDDAAVRAPELGDYNVTYEENYTATIPDHNVTITLEGLFDNTSISPTDHYALIQALPHWECLEEGAKLIYLDGKAYFRIPITTLNSSPSEGYLHGKAAIAMKVPAKDLLNTTSEDGLYKIPLQVGTQSITKGTNTEVVFDNNYGSNTTGNVTVIISPVDSNVRLVVSSGYEDNITHYDDIGKPVPGKGMEITVSGVSRYDTITELTLTFNEAKGSLAYEGQVLNLENLPDNISYSQHGDNITFTIKDFDGRPGKTPQVTIIPKEGAGNADIGINWSYKIKDELSGDSRASGDHTVIGIVDAVAGRAEVGTPEIIFGGIGEGQPQDRDTAKPGELVTLSTTLTPDGPGQTYLLIEMVPDWTLHSVNGQSILISDLSNPYYFPDGSVAGGVYFRLPLDFTLNGKPVFIKGEDGNYKIDLVFKAPNNADIHAENGEYHVGIGSLTETTATDQEIDYTNNRHINIIDSTLKVGGIKTGPVYASFGKDESITENDPTGTNFALTVRVKVKVPSEDGKEKEEIKEILANEVAEKNGETVSQVVLKFSQTGDGGIGEGENGSIIGSIIYKGMVYHILKTGGGTGEVGIDFGQSGYDGSNLTVVWGTVVMDENGTWHVTSWNHAVSETITIDTRALLVNDKSGFSSNKTTHVDVAAEATPDAPSNIEGSTESQDPIVAGSSCTIIVKGQFADIDGSEEHYLLVQQLSPDWQCITPAGVGLFEKGGINFFKIPVANTEATPEAIITLMTPAGQSSGTLELICGGLSVEKGKEDSALTGKVTLSMDGVNSTGIMLSMDPTDEGSSSPMIFTLIGDNNSGETLSTVTVTVPQGGWISGPDGKLTPDNNGKVILDGTAAKNGEYSYHPPAHSSGSQELKVEAVVKGSGGSAQKTLPGDSTIEVRPVTDQPIMNSGDASATCTVLPGHKADFIVELKAQFDDTDGSEQHFFLAKLPDGILAPHGWVLASGALLAASGLEGNVYILELSDPTAQNSALRLELSKTYPGEELIIVAGSYEKALEDNNPNKYQFSNEQQIGLPEQEYNIAPEAPLVNFTFDTLRNKDLGGGKITGPKDKDNDTLTIALLGDVNGDEDEHGRYTEVEGKYGTLRMYEDGSYTYTLYPEFIGTAHQGESFDYTVSDGLASSQGVISIDLSNTNKAPIISGDLKVTAGGGNSTIANGKLAWSDPENDTLSIIVKNDEAEEELLGDSLSITGKYGTLKLHIDGSYKYTLDIESHHMEGKEIFSIVIKDDYGAITEKEIQIDIRPVNHAPDAENVTVAFDDPTITAKIGSIDLDSFDRDMSFPINNDLIIISAINGITFTGSKEVVGTYGTLTIYENGGYTYNLHGDINAGDVNAYDSFRFTVRDSGGLEDSAYLNFKFGTPTDPEPTFSNNGLQTFDMEESASTSPFALLARAAFFGGDDTVPVIAPEDIRSAFQESQSSEVTLFTNDSANLYKINLTMTDSQRLTLTDFFGEVENFSITTESDNVALIEIENGTLFEAVFHENALTIGMKEDNTSVCPVEIPLPYESYPTDLEVAQQILEYIIKLSSGY